MANGVRAIHEYRHNPNVNDPNAGGAREASDELKTEAQTMPTCRIGPSAWNLGLSLFSSCYALPHRS
jgi:hypothetical protein